MSTQRSRADGQRPRTFTPPRPRRPKRQRTAHGWPHPGWRDRVIPSVARAFCAVAFAGFSAIVTRFGDSALVVASLGLASFIAAIVYVAVKMQSEFTFGVLVPDVVALVVLPPVLWIASGIKVADARFGGNAGHFLLATTAVLAATGIVFFVAAIANASSPSRAVLGSLAGALSVIAILGAGNRFSSGSLPDGMSLAWMAAAALTLADGIVPPRLRRALQIAGIGGFLVVTVIVGMSSTSQGTGNTSNSLIALTAALGVCGLLMLLPGLTSRLRSGMTDELAQYQDRIVREPVIRAPGDSRQFPR